MHYVIDNRFHETGPELAAIFKTIPSGTTSLELSWSNLGNKPVVELVNAFNWTLAIFPKLL